jgi:hypothetical protein
MAQKAVRYDPGTTKYSIRSAGADVEITPGGSGNATSIRGYPVETGTPLEGEVITYDADGEEWIYATGSGGVPEAPNDGKLYARKSLAWTEATAAEVGAEAAGTTAAHAALTTGVHGVGAGTVASEGYADSAVSTHAALTTGVHGAGASTLATTADIASHASLSASVHGVSASGFEDKGSKGAASGYCGLDASQRVAAANLATGTPDGTKFLRDDRTWQVPAGGSGLSHAQVMSRASLGF